MAAHDRIRLTGLLLRSPSRRRREGLRHIQRIAEVMARPVAGAIRLRLPRARRLHRREWVHKAYKV